MLANRSWHKKHALEKSVQKISSFEIIGANVNKPGLGLTFEY